MKVPFAMIIAILLSGAPASAALYFKNISSFDVLGALSQPSVELEVKCMDGNSQKIQFHLMDDKYRELTKFSAKNPFSTGSNNEKFELWSFQDLAISSFMEVQIQAAAKNGVAPKKVSQVLWIEPEILAFDLRILKSQKSFGNQAAFLEVKVKDEVIASGYIRERHSLQVKEKSFVDGNQKLDSILVVDNHLDDSGRFFDLEIQLSRQSQASEQMASTTEIQKIRVKIDLNKIQFTSRLSHGEDASEDTESL